MWSTSAKGISRPSLVRKAMLVRYVSAETEKSRNPPVTAMQNLIQFHANNVSESCNGVGDFLPTPRRLRSTATMVPIQSDNPVKWDAWTIGYAQSDPAMDKAYGLFCSQCPKLTNRPSIRIGLPSLTFCFVAILRCWVACAAA